MIRCENCNYSTEYTGKICTACGATLTLSEQALAELLDTVYRAKENREYETVEEGYRILADFDVREGLFEYGRILEERGEYDEAMRFFCKGAKRGDAPSAYRYGKLLSRYRSGASDFYTLLSAVLGAEDAYREAGEVLLERSEYELSEYFYRLAIDVGDVEACVTLAKRYAEGIGTDIHEPFAKWCLDKLRFPPVNALKLAYRLRGVIPEEPPMPVTDGYARLLVSLLAEAEAISAREEAYLLTELLAQRGDLSASLRLALCALSGDGCEKDPDRAKKTLYELCEKGYVPAMLSLSRLLLSGEHFPIDQRGAISLLEKAARLGSPEAYRTLGDLYCEGGDDGRRLAYAITLYDEGARLGDSVCADKSLALKTRREEAFRTALQRRKSSPEDAFRLFAISASMGYTPAEVRLGDCYLFGTGTKKSRRHAFLWYKSAAKHGEADALYPLGMCYARGVGTRFDYKKAISTLQGAEAVGSQRAGEEARRLLLLRLKKMKRSLYSAGMRLLYQKKPAVAFRMIDAAAKMGDTKAIYTLGALFEFGIGTAEDRDLAKRLYSEAVQKGFSDPRSKYKSIILKLIR